MYPHCFLSCEGVGCVHSAHIPLAFETARLLATLICIFTCLGYMCHCKLIIYFKGEIMKKCIFFFLLFNVGYINANEWYSMARHGECVPLSFLGEEIKEFRGVTSPKQLIENYIASGSNAKLVDLSGVDFRGFEYITQEGKTTRPSKGTAYQIVVDDHPEWILLEKQYCKEFL